MNSKKMVVFILEPYGTESDKILGEVAEVRLGHADAKYAEDELIKESQDVDALLITSRDGISRKTMEQCKKLKAIVKYGAKPSNVDYQAATELGIAVSWTPSSNAVSVAEHALMLIFALLKGVCQCMNAQKEGKWRYELAPCSELQDKTVGIVGLGQAGSELAKRLSCFNVKLIGRDPFVSKKKTEQLGVELKSLNELLGASDIVSLHCELNKDTKHMISTTQLKMMKNSAILVNTARGGLIDTDALYNALKEGAIAGAGLDVFDEEPTQPDNPLFSLDNVIHTPHMAGITYEVIAREPIWAAQEVVRILKGEGGKNVLNPEYVKNARANQGQNG